MKRLCTKPMLSDARAIVRDIRTWDLAGLYPEWERAQLIEILADHCPEWCLVGEYDFWSGEYEVVTTAYCERLADLAVGPLLLAEIRHTLVVNRSRRRHRRRGAR